MIGSLRRQVESAAKSEGLPLLLVLTALATTLLFSNDRGHFYRLGHHNYLSSHGMTLAASLSAEHSFLMFISRHVNSAGEPQYRPYNRFSIGSFLLIKAAILPFEDDFSRQIHAARLLMLAFFGGAALLAYRSITRLTTNSWIAATATLLGFASYYCLYYNDMVFNDVPSLFGVVLTFHGMVVFIQEGRFRQLLLKTAVALLIGWQVYGLILSFVAVGVGVEVYGYARSAGIGVTGRSPYSALVVHFRDVLRLLVGSSYIRLGVFATLFGISVLASLLTNEYRGLRTVDASSQLPSVLSISQRVGLTESAKLESRSDVLEWRTFLGSELERIGQMVVPHSLVNISSSFGEHGISSSLIHRYGFRIVAVIALAVCAVGLWFGHHRILLASAIMGGFCWSLPMRNFTAFHDFQSLFYIGIPLALFSLALVWLVRHTGGRLMVILVALSLMLFVSSSYQISDLGVQGVAKALNHGVQSDFENIRELLPDGARTFIPNAVGTNAQVQFAGAAHVVNYYLSGRYIQPDREAAEFIITRSREDSLPTLTPDNRYVFVYDRVSYDRQLRELSEPIIEFPYKVYLSGTKLVYMADTSCEDDAFRPDRLFLNVTRADGMSAGPTDRLHFEGMRGFEIEGRCTVEQYLPPYQVSRLRTGERDSTGLTLWAQTVILDRESYERRYSDLGAPIVKSVFDVYLVEDRLAFVRDGSCDSSSNVAGSTFFVHVFPVDGRHLPLFRRIYGYDNLDFYPAEMCFEFDGHAIIERALPDYEWEIIRTGQYTAGDRRLWSVTLRND